MKYTANRLLQKSWIGERRYFKYHAIWEVLDEKTRHPLEISIHVDSSYWFQSYARLHRFDGKKWNLVVSLPETEIEEVYQNLGNPHRVEGYDPSNGHLKLEEYLLGEFRLIMGI